ncbi:ribosylpyrimidine nucleosidase [Paenibacillus lautus]|uniref:nucleoside hydrolase n=1 Tax=Paenibacillus TaxID=44249 RepID=UPI000BF6D54C|nr:MULTISPECIES: nucleoside hydrolase [Paenibacillus]GIP00764.1 ribosylpyrimidine nucleosidase [Paenibacillus lautus]
MHRIVLDVDTGVDDALAIAYAVRSSALDILGITTCFGNVPVEYATRNTLHVLDRLGAAGIPVAMGEAAPLFHPSMKSYPVQFHGENGLGNLAFPDPAGKPVSTSAAAFMVDQIRRYPKQVTLICVGPLTNLAAAILQAPEISSLVRQIIVMGGAVGVAGNRRMHAEANVYSDPEAAQLVFQSGAPITLVGLDVTMQTELSLEDIQRWRDLDSDLTRFLADMTSYYIGGYRESYGDRTGCALHDPLAVAVAIDLSLVEVQPMVLQVDLEGIHSYGRTIADLRPRCTDRPNVNVCTGVDAKRFQEHFMETLMR